MHTDVKVLSANNGNRREWSPIRSVIIQVIDKIGQLQQRILICESCVWLQAELEDMKSSNQLIKT